RRVRPLHRRGGVSPHDPDRAGGARRACGRDRRGRPRPRPRAGPVRRVDQVKLGVSLPNFRDDPEPALAVARAAEPAGPDGVFGVEHLSRGARAGARRPARGGMTLLGAVAAETPRVAFGPLVARASLRPAATLAAAFDTLARIAPGRLIATIGAGDSQSREENDTFGLSFGTLGERIAALADAVDTAIDRGYPVWVGGASASVGA